MIEDICLITDSECLTDIMIRNQHTDPLFFQFADNILVDLSRYWCKVQPENEGLQIRLEPSVIGANVNIALKKYGRKMGPDPASINGDDPNWT